MGKGMSFLATSLLFCVGQIFAGGRNSQSALRISCAGKELRLLLVAAKAPWR